MVADAPPGYEAPAYHKFVGIGLALLSSLFIGLSFILKKRALIRSRHGQAANQKGHAYLRNPLWWTGMTMMLVGEVCNLGAYSFSPAVLVTPLGALSVVISAVLSSAMLKEHLSFAAKVGCAQCVLGATILVLHAPVSGTTTTLQSFADRVVTAGFLVYFFLNLIVIAVLVFYISPRYGQKHAIVSIAICSLTGAFVVIATQGLGSAIVFTLSNPDEPSQFKDWRLYILFLFVVSCGVMQINFLNKALNVFSTAIVTPIYYVCFTAATLIASAILFRTFALGTAVGNASLVVGFLVIVSSETKPAVCTPRNDNSSASLCLLLFSQCGGVSLLFAFSREERRRGTEVALPTPIVVGDAERAVVITGALVAPAAELDHIPLEIHDDPGVLAPALHQQLSSVVKLPMRPMEQVSSTSLSSSSSATHKSSSFESDFTASHDELHVRASTRGLNRTTAGTGTGAGPRPRMMMGAHSWTSSASSPPNLMSSASVPSLPLRSNHSPWWSDRSAG
ncbi:magnesium transporter NIPA-domain-containing protein [Geranomyces variabilis]|nr:magnesium transporter NIPA-domain-containing protein [Geranomyces variabilis]